MSRLRLLSSYFFIAASISGCIEAPDSEFLLDFSASSTSSGGSASNDLQGTSPGMSTDSSWIPSDSVQTSSESASSNETAVDANEESQTTSDSESPEDSTRECAATETCLGPVPEGWSGPFTKLTTVGVLELPQCPASVPVFMEDLYSDLLGAPAQCDGCGFDVVAPECSSAVVVSVEELCPAVGETPAQGGSRFDVPRDSCVDLKSFGHNSMILEGGQPVGEGSCYQRDAGVELLPEIQWGTSHRFCATPAEANQCATGGTCFPEVVQDEGAQRCIVAEGDQVCPDDTYGLRTVLYRGVKDTRTCGTCEAEHVAGELRCEDSWWLFKGESCAAHLPKTSLPASEVDAQLTCLFDIGFVGYKSMMVASSVESAANPRYSGTCETQTWGPAGEAVADQPVTVCCAR